MANHKGRGKRWAVAACAGVALLATSAVAWAASGGLDLTFGSGGVATAPTLYPAQDVEVQRLGTAERYLATGFLQNGGLYVAAFAPNGLPDATFGSNGDGVVKLFPGDTAVNTSRGDLLVDSVGRVLRVGTSTLTTVLVGNNGKTQTQTSTSLTVVRLTQNGLLDTTFGGTGIVRLTVADRYVNGVAQLASGRIVVAGTGLTGTKNNMWERTVLVCLNGDGSLYGGFGQNGVSNETLRTSTAYCGVGVQSGDRIVVGSTAYLGNPLVAQWHIARYTTTGSLDASFGSGGRVLSTVAALVRLVVDPTSGEITAAGQKDSTPRQIAVARHSADGALMLAFGQSGYATLGMSGIHMYLGDLCLQPDGKILVGCNPSGVGTTVARLNADGTSDAGFGNGGTSDLVAGYWYGNGVAVAADGIVTAGQFPKTGGGSGLYVARYQP